jgi:hypothetical protein
MKSQRCVELGTADDSVRDPEFLKTHRILQEI